MTGVWKHYIANNWGRMLGKRCFRCKVKREHYMVWLWLLFVKGRQWELREFCVVWVPLTHGEWETIDVDWRVDEQSSKCMVWCVDYRKEDCASGTWLDAFEGDKPWSNLRWGSSKRSIRMRSGSVGWLLVSMVGKSVILSMERGGQCRMMKLSSQPLTYVTLAVMTSRQMGLMARLALMMRLPLGDQKMVSM